MDTSYINNRMVSLIGIFCCFTTDPNCITTQQLFIIASPNRNIGEAPSIVEVRIPTITVDTREIVP